MKKLVKKISLVLCMVMALGTLSACGSSNTGNVNGEGNVAVEDESLNIIKENGKIILGTSADYPPYEWHVIEGTKDEITGVDIEIAKAAAEDLGVELEIKDMQFNGLIPSLKAGDVDMVIAGMCADEKRRKAVDFTEPYIEQNQVILIRKDDSDEFKSLEDLKDKKVGTQLGTMQQEYADANFGAEVIGVPNNNDLVLELKNGTLDAIFMTEFTAKEFTNINDDLVLAEISDIPKEGGSSIAVKKGNAALLEELNKTVKKLKEEKKVEDWFVQYSNLMDENK